MQPVHTPLLQHTIVHNYINQNLFLSKHFHSRHKVVNTLRKRHFTSISTATNCTAKRLNSAEKQTRTYTYTHTSTCDVITHAHKSNVWETTASPPNLPTTHWNPPLEPPSKKWRRNLLAFCLHIPNVLRFFLTFSKKIYPVACDLVDGFLC